MGELNAALRAGTLEQVLDRMAPEVLPDPAESGGALRVLGDVARDLGQDMGMEVEMKKRESK